MCHCPFTFLPICLTLLNFVCIGGDLNTFLPIVVSGKESGGTSDLSLEHLLQELQGALAKGVRLGKKHP